MRMLYKAYTRTASNALSLRCSHTSSKTGNKYSYTSEITTLSLRLPGADPDLQPRLLG